jgi:hypothetical protein
MNVRAALSTTLPQSAISGSNISGKALLGLVNLTPEPLTADATVTTFLSADESLDAGDILIGEPVAVRLKMRGYGMKRVALRVTNLPSVPDGSYHLLACLDAGGAGETAAVGVKAIDLRHPLAELKLSIAGQGASAGERYVVPVAIHNVGNTTARGPATVSLSFGSADGGASIPVAATAQVKLNIKPGATLVRKIVFQLPAALPPGASTPAVTLNVDAIPHAKLKSNDELFLSTGLQ